MLSAVRCDASGIRANANVDKIIEISYIILCIYAYGEDFY